MGCPRIASPDTRVFGEASCFELCHSIGCLPQRAQTVAARIRATYSLAAFFAAALYGITLIASAFQLIAARIALIAAFHIGGG